MKFHYRNSSTLKILNVIKLILDDQGNHMDSYTISLESFRSFRGPLLRKPVTGQKLFFAVSYSKLALAEQVGGVNQELEDMKNPRVLTSKVIYTRTRTHIFESFSTSTCTKIAAPAPVRAPGTKFQLHDPDDSSNEESINL